MSGRMPSFIIVGIFIIMFLLAVFYTSCSSKNSELRSSVEQFEERVRSLTIKNSDAEKKIENLNTRKRELEEEKSVLHRQIEKKNSEINDLNTKINEKLAEFKSLASDKDALNKQLKECQMLGDTVADKNSVIEKLQKEISKEKEFNANERIRLQQEIDDLKNRRPPVTESAPAKDQQNVFQAPQQRFVPLLAMNTTTRSIIGILQGGGQSGNDVPREVKPNIVPAVSENPNKFSNSQNLSKSQPIYIPNPAANQNLPVPPVAAVPSQQGQENRIESAQVPPKQNQPGEIGKQGNIEQLRQEEKVIDNANKNNPDIVNDDDDEDDEDEVDNNDRLNKREADPAQQAGHVVRPVENKEINENVHVPKTEIIETPKTEVPVKEKNLKEIFDEQNNLKKEESQIAQNPNPIAPANGDGKQK